MTTLLVILTVLLVLIIVGALATYLVVISASLTRTSQNLAKVTFGVRAIETQCSSIGPSVTRANEQLTVIAGALSGLVDKAEQLGGAE
jgi:uncharacterized membrane protein